MFHSRGTVQSGTAVPEKTSLTSRWRWRIASVCRSPLPEMLRQIGKSSWMSAIALSPLASERGAHASKGVLHNLKFSFLMDPSILAGWFTSGWDTSAL
jgi:hypothetical protein